MPRSDSLKELRSLKMTTPEGRALQKFAVQFVERIDSKEKAFEVLQKVGIYNEDGSPNPYFFPGKSHK